MDWADFDYRFFVLDFAGAPGFAFPAVAGATFSIY